MPQQTDSTADKAPALLSFPHPFQLLYCPHDHFDFSTGFEIRTLLEKQLDAFTTKIRLQSHWWQKVWRNDNIQEWRQLMKDDSLPSTLFEFGIKQLQHLSTQCTPDGVRPSPVNLVYESDEAIGDSLLSDICNGLTPLEQHCQKEQLGRDNNVKLVDPSLFLLAKGISHTLAGAPNSEPPGGFTTWKTCMGTGEVVEQLPEVEYDSRAILNGGEAPDDNVLEEDKPGMLSSRRFQWLPSDVEVGEDGSVRVLSYINNMHPEWHASLYEATEVLLQRCLPLFERTLASAAHPKHRAIRAPDESKVIAFSYPWLVWAEEMAAEQGIEDHEEAIEFAKNYFYEALEDEERFIKEFFEGEIKVPEEFSPPPSPTPVCLRGRTIQVVVRYESIVVRPEEAGYGGSLWEVEGMRNEGIVAACHACVRCHNLSPPCLEFLSMVDHPYITRDEYWRPKLNWGVEHGDNLTDNLGAVEQRRGGWWPSPTSFCTAFRSVSCWTAQGPATSPLPRCCSWTPTPASPPPLRCPHSSAPGTTTPLASPGSFRLMSRLPSMPTWTSLCPWKLPSASNWSSCRSATT